MNNKFRRYIRKGVKQHFLGPQNLNYNERINDLKGFLQRNGVKADPAQVRGVVYIYVYLSTYNYNERINDLKGFLQRNGVKTESAQD